LWSGLQMSQIWCLLWLAFWCHWDAGPFDPSQPRVFCKAFKDNSGALELAHLPKMRPQTKHINIKYHHFREHVRLGLIEQSTPYFYLRTACLLIYSPSHSHRTPFSSSGRLCCTISEFTCFINSYWIRECDITVNLYVF
jgi:hypothetical protein